MSSPQHPRPKRFAPRNLALLGLAALALSGCGKNQQGGGPGGPGGGFPMLESHVLTVATQPVTLSRELPGRTSAYRVAEVRARITGIVLKRHFTEGADVRAGQLLFEIDPEPYQATLDSARANLARAEASLFSAQAQARRYKDLVGTDAISRQTYDNAEADAKARAADVAAARAAVRSAEINLGYTRVVAPISGRIGRAEVTEGAYVQQAQATLLATIQQLDPLYVDLSQPAEDALQLKTALDSGLLKKNGSSTAKLTVLFNNGETYGERGTLAFSDVTVSPTTGTVTLRGTVPNPHLSLLPGMFVHARVEEGTKPDAILVPQSVVTRNALGQATVLVIEEGGPIGTVAGLRVIEVSRTVGSDWLVTGGLQPGDRVILDNLQKLRPGVPVKPLPPAGPSAAPAAR
ncbi:efflux transporter periplasmic adaptor subunit [Cephaloticoccus primus]|uniref:Efflux transporter periplasmic adaptor subunit n=1 Tax=Cephaloticoccus primus TaxID=1548207 RepID=A0A139SSY3_9BACT|nr:efflux RND transporter periplasmic adaptor subunit [Cephaloticoccus primus]KXU37612.1 efflux transporter periplasmic adaptor subunit [Cephaloticoccus primus]